MIQTSMILLHNKYNIIKIVVKNFDTRYKKCLGLNLREHSTQTFVRAQRLPIILTFTKGKP